MSPQEMIECLKKVLATLEKEHGGEGEMGGEHEDGLVSGEEPPAGEVAAEGAVGDNGVPTDDKAGGTDTGTVKFDPNPKKQPEVDKKYLNPKGSRDVGDVKKTGGTADTGTVKFNAQPEKQGEVDAKYLKPKGSRDIGTGTVVSSGKRLFG